MRSRPFWLLINVILFVFHVVAAFTFFTDANAFDYIWIKLWMALFFIHFMELPIAFLATQERPASMVQTILMTLFFGATWWLPVRLGVFGQSPIQR